MDDSSDPSERFVSPPPPPPLVDTTPENEDLPDKISHEEQEDLDEDPLDMADVLQQLLQSQQTTNKTIADAMAQLVTALGNNNAANDKRLLAETVYDEFKSSDYPDDSHLALQEYSGSADRVMVSSPVDVQDPLYQEVSAVNLEFVIPSKSIELPPPSVDTQDHMYHEEPVFSPLPPPPIDTDRRFNTTVTKSRNKFVTNKPPDIVQMEQSTTQELAMLKLNQCSSLRLSIFTYIDLCVFPVTLYVIILRNAVPLIVCFAGGGFSAANGKLIAEISSLLKVVIVRFELW